MERGSIDILAASQRAAALGLMTCMITTPKDQDFRNLLASVQILSREVFRDASVRILPLMCTCAPGQVESVDGVPVLDADRLAVALRLLSLGREQDVLSFVESSGFHQLRTRI